MGAAASWTFMFSGHLIVLLIIMFLFFWRNKVMMKMNCIDQWRLRVSTADVKVY